MAIKKVCMTELKIPKMCIRDRSSPSDKLKAKRFQREGDAALYICTERMGNQRCVHIIKSAVFGIPVSYTHLDVYKRQPYSSSVRLGAL